MLTFAMCEYMNQSGLMAVSVFAFVCSSLHLPYLASAAACAENGYTVIFVNGVLNDVEKARSNSEELQRKIGLKFHNEPLAVRLGHNPPHIAGAADLAQAVSQALGRPVSNFDRDTILRQIHPEVKTRKILLVGHSQGTFYTNELYKYLIQNGVPKSAISVYNIATPAHYVEDGNKYLTSANDGTITKIREWAAGGEILGGKQPLPANILIPIQNPTVSELWRGHSFSGEYLAGASVRIVQDIEKALNQLKAEGLSTGADGCFNPPESGVAHALQSLGFSIADPLAQTTFTATVVGGKAIAWTVSAIYDATRYAVSAMGSALSGLFGTGSDVPYHKRAPRPWQ
jgi:hypothetical protein